MEQGLEPTIDQPATAVPDVDPSINPTKLVVQDGEFAGAINAFETSPATLLDENGEKKEGVANSEQPYQVEGLPLIGAHAGIEARDEIKNYDNIPDDEIQDEIDNKWTEAIEALAPNPWRDEIEAKYYDDAETEAMAAAVKKKAMTLVPEAASDGVREEYGEIAATKFRDELKIKLAERKDAEEAAAKAEAERKALDEEEAEKKKAATEAADATTREMMEKLKDAGTKLSDVMKVPEAPVEVPDHIDATPDLSPESEETGDWKPEHLESSDQPV